jgi:SAM-dependent methyltransferase
VNGTGPGDGVTDRAILAGRAYATGQGLEARQSLYRYQRPRHDLPGIVERELADARGPVLDVGCGNGVFLRHLSRGRPDLVVVGFDVAPGILAAFGPDIAPRVVADAQRLPIVDGSAAAVLAMHMLYHVPDIGQALDEADRVLVPGGRFIGSTNSATDKHELDRLWTRAAADVLGVAEGPSRVSLSARFTLEDAPGYLVPRFHDVRVTPLPGVITVTDPAPIVAHLASYRAWADRSGVPFDQTLRRAAEIAADTIARRGSFQVTCLSGILTARSGPGAG